MANQTFLDITNDHNYIHLFKIIQEGFIKKAELNSIEKESAHFYKKSFMKEAYADPALLLFPCPNPKFTVLNWHYFLSQVDNMPEIMVKTVVKNFKKFAQIHDVSNTLNQIFRTYYEKNKLNEKSAQIISNELNYYPRKQENFSDFALLYEKNGHVYKLLPIRNEYETRLAVKFLQERAKSIPFIHRIKIAERILDKIDKNNWLLPQQQKLLLRKMALHGSIPVKALKAELKKLLDVQNPKVKVGRAKFSKKYSSTINSWLDELNKLPDNRKIKTALCIKIIRFIDTAKREDGLYDLPSEEIPEKLSVLPEECPPICCLKSGHILDLNRLLDIPKTILKKFFGPEIEDFITNDFGALDEEKVKAWAESLPAPDAKTLVIIIKKTKPDAIVESPQKEDIESIDEDLPQWPKEEEPEEEESEEESKTDSKENKKKEENKKEKRKDNNEDNSISDKEDETKEKNDED